MSDKKADKETDKLMDSLKGLVIGASGNIPGYQHRHIKKMVEKCGATFAQMDVSKCTHLVTTHTGIRQGHIKVDRAIASGECHIVNVDWLLKSIENQSPEEVQQYKLLQSKNAVNATDLTGNKRARESDSDDEDVGSLKKPKDERKIRFAKLAALVDSEIITDGDRTLSVWMDDAGEIWDATLMNTVTHVEGQKRSQATSIIRLQLILDSNSDKYYVFQVQREIPTTRDEPSSTTHEEFCDTLDGARCDFEGRFRSQSGLLWKDRHEIPKDDRFVSLELQYEEPVVLVSEKCAFAQSVEDVLGLIFKKGDFERFVNSMSTYGRRMDLAGQFKGHTLQAGIAILRKIVELYGKIAMKSCGPQVDNLCNLYSVLMVNGAQDFTYNQPGLAPIMGELMTLDLAIKLHTASNILRRKNSRLNTSMTMRQISHALGLAKLTPVDQTSKEYVELCNYLHGSARKAHARQFKQVVSVFRLKRPGEMQRFARWEKENTSEIGDRRLLWHGSSTVNFAGILSQGLRHGGLCSANGKRFCPGIYFADMSTKSLGYCQGQKQALMALCEVELGRPGTGLSVTNAAATVHSKWRDAGCIHEDFVGTQIPDVRVPPEQVYASGLYHPEYVVQDPAQVRLQYLFRVQLQ
ncbi:uncharacterized protein N7446_009344 [Penicillium canescens]|uniref:Poly [ADP-ribose] polymerase n=1 Tax=Penicillium canescens TaxID=5083 RepID=A0AAD6I631_PENCN|nr:uncharacterized protein N7446_009344 [Penicillium canescens]KAJ6034592.1 hypothetical protein N7460_008767 [Penicillium canescens]KAJ6046252.1 hypothetical protein N7444_007506 [Penicillium canescens]KAJ6053332.1 hypothetical protein N7446_009344 [Penicillium canescens]